MAPNKRVHNVAAVFVFLVVAVLLWTAVDASRQLTRLELVSRVSCDQQHGRVFVSGRGGVRVLDASGASQGVLLGADGRPARLDGVSAVRSDPAGRVWVVEAPRGRVQRFADKNGALMLEALVLDRAGTFEGPADILPFVDGSFVIADTIAHELRLHGADGKVVKKHAASFPNSPLRLDEGSVPLGGFKGGRDFLVVITGDSDIAPFSDDLEPIPWPQGGETPFRKFMNLPLEDSVYVVESDDAGYVYWNSCPGSAHCTLRRRTPQTDKIDVAGADDWFERYDDTDPAYHFCVTADGRLLSASQTLGAVVQYQGALDAKATPPSSLTWDDIAVGFEAGKDLRISLFGDDELRAWTDEGRRQRQALRDRLGFARGSLGGLLTLLTLIYLVDRMLGRHGGLKTTLRNAAAVGRWVLWPDRGALARWALPGLVVWALAALAALVLYRLQWAGTAEFLALAVVTGFFVPRMLSARRLAERRSPRTARDAFELYMSSATVPSFKPAAASFAAPPDSGEGESMEKIVEEAVGVEDPLEIAAILEGKLVLIAWGEDRIVWYPCQLGGKPKGTIRTAGVEPRPRRPKVKDGPSPSHLHLCGQRFVGVTVELIRGLGTWPRTSNIQELCALCGRELTDDPAERCPHHRFRPRSALALAVLLPGLGHLSAGLYQRGRWLLVVAALLISRMLYLAIPMGIGSLPFDPIPYVVPLSLYAVVWWFSISEMAHHRKSRRV